MSDSIVNRTTLFSVASDIAVHTDERDYEAERYKALAAKHDAVDVAEEEGGWRLRAYFGNQARTYAFARAVHEDQTFGKPSLRVPCDTVPGLNSGVA